MGNYFLTGATGFVGGHLADQLLEAGHHLVVIARDPEDASDLTERGAEVVQGDVTDTESMRDPESGRRDRAKRGSVSERRGGAAAEHERTAEHGRSERLGEPGRFVS